MRVGGVPGDVDQEERGAGARASEVIVRHRGGESGAMGFYQVLDQVVALLRERGRVTYRGLKREFQLDDACLEDLKDELINAQHLAVDEQTAILVWTGTPPGAEPGNRQQAEADRRLHTSKSTWSASSRRAAPQISGRATVSLGLVRRGCGRAWRSSRTMIRTRWPSEKRSRRACGDSTCACAERLSGAMMGGSWPRRRVGAVASGFATGFPRPCSRHYGPAVVGYAHARPGCVGVCSS
jgi:hypothetical protein